MKFTHLHVHSHYSLLDGLSKIDDLLTHVKNLGMDSVALTDHGVLYGAVEFFKKAKEKGVKPIIGCEVYVAYEKMDQKRSHVDDKRYHLVLLVKNETGYKNLVKLITKAHLEGFYYKPRIDENLLAQHSEGLIALSACLQGKIPQLILAKKIEEAEKTALKYQEMFGKGNFYLELQDHPNIPNQKKINEALISISKKLNIPLVATNDCHYLKEEDAKAQDILMLINTNAKLDDPERLTMLADDFSVRSPQKMIESFKDVPEAIENTQKIADQCNFEFKFGELKFPYYPLPEGKDAGQYLKELAFQGLEKRGFKKEKEVIGRLEYELSVIKETGFAPYFLIVQDFVNWAKGKRIVVGPGRGSAGGSLVAYLLNITNVNPLKYNLLFERFINPQRVSPPDIDLDFADNRRDEVIQYVAQKYGRDRVAQIITFGTMAARAVVRDVGRALNYNYSFCDKIAKLIPAGFTLDEALAKVKELRDLYQSDPKVEILINFSKKLEGCARHASTHACGVVISKDPLTEFVPLQHPTQDEENIVTQYDMRSIENLGLLKMDFLGLKNLTIIEETLKMIYAIHKKNVDIDNIPLDDKSVYKLLQRGDCVGVFQLESEGMRKYLRQLKPTTLEDIIAMIALYRPGPMALIPDYIAGKNKKKKVEYMHPKLKPILESTYGVPVYQEQIMQIAQEIAGFSLAEADVLRKAIGKKIKKLLMDQKEKFINGAKSNGIDESVAQKIWHWFEPFARYSFNKSHSAAYAIIAYQTAYLKTHYPLEFMASLLTSEKADVERIGFLIEECQRMGIQVLPPDVNESYRYFSVVPEDKKIRFGLAAIKNVGEAVADEIVKERKKSGKFKSIDDFISRMSLKVLNKKSLESLIKAGTFDQFEERKKLLKELDSLLESARDIQKNKMNGQFSLFGEAKLNHNGSNNQNHNQKLNQDEDCNGSSKIENLIWEKELLGLYISGHPLDGLKLKFLEKVLPIEKINKSLVGKRVKIIGVISSLKKIITKSGAPMIFLKLEDKTNRIEVVTFPSVLERNPQSFEENKVVLITGRIDNKDNVPKIICEDIEEIIEN